MRNVREDPCGLQDERGPAAGDGRTVSAEGVGEDDQGDHDDGEDDNGYLQVLLEESAELNGTQALLLEDRRTVFVMAMVMVMFLFHIT